MADPKRPMELKCRRFSAVIKSWDALFAEVAELANELGPERVVSISHSSDGGGYVVLLWYWVPARGTPGALSPPEGGGEVSMA